MREIKFRFWNGKKMDYRGDDVSIWNGLVVCEGDTIPMQFTGLKDKNGKEIYEGDIIVLHGHACVVIYAPPVFSLEVTDNPNRHVGLELPFEVREVIGNIYENPEKVR